MKKLTRVLKTAAAVTAAAAMAVSLAACGEKDNSGSIASGGAKKTIAVVAKGESHAFWQSVKSGAEDAAEKYGYSIRINEARLLPDEINRIGAFHRQKLKKAVISISVDESYSVNDSNCYRIRRVEKELYQDYVPDGFNCDDAITYQWNQNRDTDMQGRFNFYFDIARDYISKMSMLLYMIILMIVGIAGGFLWDFIKVVLFGLNW